MALTDKLTAIADGFRTSRGITGKMNLDRMAELAAEKVAEDPLILPASIVEYVKNEALSVARRVADVRTEESIVFLAMSDTHQQVSTTDQTHISNIHANMAAKALTYMVPMDFVAHLGDVGSGAGGDNPDTLKAQIESFMDYFMEACGDLPLFVAIGNHDAGIYYHDGQVAAGNAGPHTLSGDYLYRTFTALSASNDTVFDGEEYGGYCYRDFPDKKLRVFLLNTSEKLVSQQLDGGTLPAQQLWVANALAELNTKSDAAGWGFVVLCHYPLDYGESRPISNVFKAYVNGESITVNGSTVNFAGANGAKFLAQFHGHVHNFKYARLNGYTGNGPMTEYEAFRLCIPNGQYNRENYYTRDYYGIYFNEDASYPKTPNTAEDTSFVVNVINPSEKMIYSICYGAGYDRAVSLEGKSYYSIVTDLTGATVESSASSVEEGKPYTGTVTAYTDYTLKSVTVTMGGVDITDSVYADGVVDIPAVTGKVVITVVAVAPPTNLLPLAIDTDNSIFNGTGYKSGIRLSTTDGSEKTADMYASGYIPVRYGQTVTLRNVGTSMVNYTYSYLIWYASLTTTGINKQVQLDTVTPNADGSLTITLDEHPDPSVIRYFRLSCSYLGADSEIYVE